MLHCNWKFTYTYKSVIRDSKFFAGFSAHQEFFRFFSNIKPRYLLQLSTIAKVHNVSRYLRVTFTVKNLLYCVVILNWYYVKDVCDLQWLSICWWKVWFPLHIMYHYCGSIYYEVRKNDDCGIRKVTSTFNNAKFHISYRFWMINKAWYVYAMVITLEISYYSAVESITNVCYWKRVTWPNQQS